MLGWGTTLAHLSSSSPGFIPALTQTHGAGATLGPCSSRADSTQERWQSRAPARTVPGEPGQGRVPGRSTHPCARHLPASTCPGGPGHSPRRGCPRGHRPAAAGACRCSQGTACRRRTWLSAPSSGWGLQRRSRGTTGSHQATAAPRGDTRPRVAVSPASPAVPASPTALACIPQELPSCPANLPPY